MKSTLHLTEPPPTVNNVFVNKIGGGRSKSKEYRGWLNAMGWELRLQKQPRVPGLVMIDITVARASGRADIDNRIKPVLDLLVHMEMIDDDRHVQEVRARWGGLEGCTIVVESLGAIAEAA